MDLTEHICESSLRVILYIIFSWLDKQHPFVRHIEEEEMWMYRYPSTDSILPKYTLYFLLVCIPSIMFLVEFLVNRRKGDIVKGIYALTLVYNLTGIFSCLLKILVGRPRPNFFMRCFPDGYGTNVSSCTGNYNTYMDGRKSFPSSHASFSFAGMSFMTLRLCKLLAPTHHSTFKGFKYCLKCIPFVCAVLIGVSRTCDYHHHYTDVLFGAILGVIISVSVYYHYYWYEEMSDEETLKIQ